jgi:hypothetical protein
VGALPDPGGEEARARDDNPEHDDGAADHLPDYDRLPQEERSEHHREGGDEELEKHRAGRAENLDRLDITTFAAAAASKAQKRKSPIVLAWMCDGSNVVSCHPARGSIPRQPKPIAHVAVRSGE